MTRRARLPKQTLPWIISTTLLLSALAALPALRTIGGADTVPARLNLSPLYIVLAPVCDVLDAMTLLSVRQHVALILTLIVVYSLWRLMVTTSAKRIDFAREAFRAAISLGALVAVYVAGCLVPRPMAALELLSSDALAVDFHSHTNASWDGRHSFTPEANRSWHRRAGFAAAYISDHGTVGGVIDAQRNNPRTAGEGTAILPAVEIRCEGQHIVLLGATIHEGIPDCSWPTTTVSSATRTIGRWKAEGIISLLTIPGRLSTDQPIPESQAIEIADGAPRALDQMQRDSTLLRKIARSDDMALVSGSNNHGWAGTAAAWSVLEIPGWRSLTPPLLDAAIRQRLGTRRARSVTVIERARVAPPQSTIGLSSTLPAVMLNMLRTLSPAERISWLVWTWVVFFIVARSQRVRRTERQVAENATRADVMVAA